MLQLKSLLTQIPNCVLEKNSTSQSGPAHRSLFARCRLARRAVSEGGFFNLRVLIASLLCLAGIFLVLIGLGIYSDSAKAQATTPAEPGSGLPTLVQMVGPVGLDQDLRSLPYIPPSEEIEERRLTRHPRPETGAPPPISGFARFQSLLEAILAPVPAMPGPVLTFDGMNSSGPNGSNCSCLPPSAIGDVGPNHYIEAVNVAFRVFDKNGNPLAPVTTFNSLFAPLPDDTPCGNNQNRGDPFVLYDHIANRWVVSDFAFPSFPGSGPFYECIGVSKTGDPVSGGWWLYALQVDPAHPNQLGDSPKFALWNNPQPGGAYIFTVDLFTDFDTFNGVRVFALDRASMIVWGPTNPIVFTIPPAGVGDSATLIPASFRTANPPPAGRDAFLLAIDNPATGGVILNQVHGWRFHVDFAVPANSTLGVGPNHAPDSNIAVAPFVDAFTDTTYLLVPQFTTSQQLDTVGDRLMSPVVYQNLNGTESLWASHTVCTDVNCAGPTAIRWYQFNVTAGNDLGNISTRSFVQTGDNVMIGGFIVHGTESKRVIIRAIGPELGLPPYNIANALANPTLELHDGTGAVIGTHDNWQTTIIGGIIGSSQVSDIQNSGHAPTAASESAIIATLPPGNYTAIVRGVNNSTGNALVEVYDLQPFFPATPVQQQSWTNGNDGLWRWMPSIAVDGAGNAAIGYSTSSTTIFPSIRYAGRLAIDALNNLAQGEAIMTVGGGAQTYKSGRWGDYSMTTVDPTDNLTFWHVNEYYVTTSEDHWATRIGKFNFSAP